MPLPLRGLLKTEVGCFFGTGHQAETGHKGAQLCWGAHIAEEGEDISNLEEKIQGHNLDFSVCLSCIPLRAVTWEKH